MMVEGVSEAECEVALSEQLEVEVKQWALYLVAAATMKMKPQLDVGEKLNWLIDWSYFVFVVDTNQKVVYV